MSESTITHSANGVTCTIEMTADEYLVSTEPMLRMAALSKWATFPRGVSFAVSAVAFFLLVSYVTEISAQERSNPAHSACSTNDFSSMARARWMRVLTLDSLESVILAISRMEYPFTRKTSVWR